MHLIRRQAHEEGIVGRRVRNGEDRRTDERRASTLTVRRVATVVSLEVRPRVREAAVLTATPISPGEHVIWNVAAVRITAPPGAHVCARL